MEHIMYILKITLSTLMVSFLLISNGIAGSDFSPAAKDKCAVCGMFVAKYPDWSCVIEYRNGQRFWFDGVKDMMKGFSNPAKYRLPKERSEIKAIWVKDYYSLALVDGRAALYVMGSDVLGPMGKELIPFSKEKDAKSFQNDHRGKKIFRFDQLTAEVLKNLE
jgi:nitrous oxide reductase accessory protein NosL